MCFHREEMNYGYKILQPLKPQNLDQKLKPLYTRWIFRKCTTMKFKVFLLSASSMGLGQKLVGRIRFFIFVVSFLTLVNGNPNICVQGSKGLRYGDPLMPYLLILVMEQLSYFMSRAMRGGFIKDFKVEGTGACFEMPHLQFKNDVLKFYEANIFYLCLL